MTRERYRAMMQFWQDRPTAARWLKLASAALTGSVYLGYLALLALLALARDGRLVRAAAVPALVFGAGSLLRRAINAPRPYEVYATPSLTHKSTKGQSFPSRHLFSAGVIAAAWGWVWPPMGWALGLVALGIGACRVLTGVHFPRDVAAGLLLGLLSGAVGFWLI